MEKFVVPLNLLYTKTHEWVKLIEEGLALIGITDYAQKHYMKSMRGII